MRVYNLACHIDRSAHQRQYRDFTYAYSVYLYMYLYRLGINNRIIANDFFGLYLVCFFFVCCFALVLHLEN